jgi:hypothetical protein
MSADVRTSFLKYYIRSLAERTRAEKTSLKIGFDWVIYNLALAELLTPCRLPFIRGGPTETSKTKTEAEFGVDVSFLSPDRSLLKVFVLKDEVLSNANWIKHSFDGDIRMAVTVDLDTAELKDVREVVVILAYNKDEDASGVELYRRLTGALGTRIGDSVKLTFERWNLSTLTEKVSSQLLTPTLLPQKFFSLFNYICSQFANMRHGSEEWSNQLIPNWRRFLADLLSENPDERTVRMLPVALLILREQGRDNPSGATGWIELTEWAMLSSWRVHQLSGSSIVKAVVVDMWVNFYIAEVERYYEAHIRELSFEHSMDFAATSSYLDTAASSVRTFWHLARIGILGVTLADFFPFDEEEKRGAIAAMRKVGNWLATFVSANPSAFRPLIDLHHIEMFVVWHTWWRLERHSDICKWLGAIRNGLFLRRIELIPIPFIEGHSNLDFVFETLATGEKPPEFCDQSSLLILFLLEISCGLKSPEREELLATYYEQVVLARDCNGEQVKELKPLHLMGWIPPAEWEKEILVRSLRSNGEAQSLSTFELAGSVDGRTVELRLREFIATVHSDAQFELPVGVIVLASLLHRSPLPPQLWRNLVFKPVSATKHAP